MLLIWSFAGLAVGYLLGSIPFGLLVTQAAGLGDVRKIGSGNIGATNVLRTGRKGLAAATLFLDALKGAVAVYLVLLVWWSFAPPASSTLQAERVSIADVGIYTSGAAAFGAMLGHCFPIWLKFRGGKGVATFVGVLFALFPLGALAFAIVWLSIAYLTRYSSLAALGAVGVMPLIAWLLGAGFVGLVLLGMAIVVVYRHSENIARLRAGTESQIGRRA